MGIHILKHRFNCSDDRAVEMLLENTYWQCFCGFNTFQSGQILNSTSMVKFRNRIGTEGMKRIEAILLQAWSEMGLVNTRRVAVDTTPQPKHIAYPTDADLLHRIKEKIVKQIVRVREEVTLRKPFRTFSRTGKRLLLGFDKKFLSTAGDIAGLFLPVKGYFASINRASNPGILVSPSLK